MRCCSGRIASKEMPSAPSVVTMELAGVIAREQSLGRRDKEHTMTPSVTAEKPEHEGPVPHDPDETALVGVQGRVEGVL